MQRRIALIGFGEAGAAFAGGDWAATAYDVKTDKDADYARAGVTGCASADAALADAQAVLVLVTADQALAAAEDYAGSIAPGALWFDMNSVAPDTKRNAAEAIEAAGGRYIDVAVMAPVHPKRRDVPLLVAAPHAEEGVETLRALGFTEVRAVAGEVGAASAIKMIRSVMVKGLEALTTECVLAAETAGVLDEVIASLNASWPGTDWAAKADYNLDRMMIHGRRRAAEMAEACETLRSLRIAPMLTEGTVGWQEGIGELEITPVPEGLSAKLAAIAAKREELGA